MTSTAGKDTDSGVPKERLPKGQKFMPRVCLKRLARTWKDEPAGKSKQVLEACRRRKEGQGIHSMAREMGDELLDCPGLAGPHASRKPG